MEATERGYVAMYLGDLSRPLPADWKPDRGYYADHPNDAIDLASADGRWGRVSLWLARAELAERGRDGGEDTVRAFGIPMLVMTDLIDN